jgi:hypothetical protein
MQRESFLTKLISPSPDWRGVITALGFGVIGNVAAELVDLIPLPEGMVQQYGPVITFVHYVLIMGAILAVMWAIHRVRRNTEPLRLVPQNEQPTPHRGLILLVGTGRPGEDPMSQSAGQAIEYHIDDPALPKLEVCWLIATGGENGSLPVAQQIQEICQRKQITAHIHTVGDPFDLQESYELVKQIYEQELPDGLTEAEVMADFTGSTKPMSAGMILACGDRRAMQYMIGRKAGIATMPKLVKFRPGE